MKLFSVTFDVYGIWKAFGFSGFDFIEFYDQPVYAPSLLKGSIIKLIEKLENDPFMSAELIKCEILEVWSINEKVEAIKAR